MHDDPDDPSALADEIRNLADLVDQHHASVEELVPLVERAIEDPELDDVGTRAAALLGQAKDPRAIDVLLRALEGSDPLDDLHDAALYALLAIGEPVLEPVLARLDAAAPDDDARYGWLELLAYLRIHDERILHHLAHAHGLARCFVAGCFAEYGDRRGLPHVHRLFDALELTGDLNRDRDVLDLAAAIEDLGGVLTDGQRRKLTDYESARDQPRVRPKLGRNEPCWCGSGAKYKRCHERADREAS